MNTTTHQILFDGSMNENSTSSRYPVAVYVPGSVNLEEQVNQCVSADFDMQISVRRYEVREVTLPSWLSAEEWIRTSSAWSFLWADARTRQLDEVFQRELLHMDSSLRYAATTLLLTKNFRSSFRQNMRDQLVAWMMTPAENRQYNTPFSRKQMEYVVSDRDVRAAKSLSRDHYYHTRYFEVAGVAA